MFIEVLKITLFGLAIVFTMLTLIILAIKLMEPVKSFLRWLFSPIINFFSAWKKTKARKKQEKLSKANAAETAASSQSVTGVSLADVSAPSPETAESDQAALVAAVIAAIEACSGLESRQFVLRSIRRSAHARQNNLYM